MSLIFVVSVGLATALATETPAAPRYFPEAFATPSYSCSGGGRPFNAAILSAFEDKWFSSHLAAAGEPSLYQATAAAKRGSVRAVRFTWLRSFHAPVIVRVKWKAGGSPTLVAKALTGAGGYRPGRVARTVDRKLTPEEANGLNALLMRTKVLAQPPKDCRDLIMVDGARWIVEGVDRAGYHYADRPSPDAGPVREFGLAMLKLTGWSFPDVY
ncbi:hypothetical protein ACFSGX_09645 [Sphingomonas arantia]|uniref:Uncharacterized protein n=1 Tax=Sphingomonas arantia TaxID=1460676 RepID=A0ABW4TZ69_9SPHN